MIVPRHDPTLNPPFSQARNMNSNLQLALPPAPDNDPGSMLSEVLAGLNATPKRLPSKFFYDARGSQLFESICEQPEYYLTRTEIDIMRSNGAEISGVLGENVRLVEFGSGNGIKTHLLLQSLIDPAAYLPVEISGSALDESVAALRTEFPDLPVVPLVGDFTKPLQLPKGPPHTSRTVVYFSGSTLGNFDQTEALDILRNIRAEVGHKGGALIGIDLKKDVAELEAAYNDQAGVTAAFTLNMLRHLNAAVGANFEENQFEHHARYDMENGRIETNIISLNDQVVAVHGRRFRFAASESMLVEYSHKYSIDEFGQMALRAGMRVSTCWTDPLKRFAVVFLTANPGPTEPSTPIW